MTRIPGLVLTDHTFTVPLDHASPGRGSIEVFAREVVASDRAGDDLPWLVFLEGGPGSKSPRPSGPGERWLGQALKTHRVLLLDQRGTGRSTPISARTVAGMTDRALADYLRLFRADSIVRDAELIRQALAGSTAVGVPRPELRRLRHDDLSQPGAVGPAVLLRHRRVAGSVRDGR